ncbi:acyl-CoA synthetase [Halomicrococcus sp. NG-SE-24]|uniref:acyl-CoA synthetase n=1 Tax=Halomicrococcus sp. NG-SE-24 TaxID=3436928 RepID=UPI003D959D36
MLHHESIQRPNVPTDRFPDPDARPDLVHALPELHYPERLNAAPGFVDRHVDAGRGDAPAIHFEGETLTYADLQERVNRLGNALRSLGVEPGERVFVRFPNRPEFAVAVLATQKIGAVPVPSMKLLQAKEVTYVLEDSAATTALVDDGLLAPVEAADEECETLETVVAADRAGVDHDYRDYDTLVADAAPTLEPADTRRDDLSMLAYTSGTTGRPKGTIHTHRQMLAIADGYARYCLDPSPDDVFTGNPPLAFTFGYGMLVAFPLRFGASTVIVQNPEPADLLDAVEAHDVTVIGSIPTAYNQMLGEHGDRLAEMDSSSLRLGVSAGEPLPPSTFDRIQERLGIELLDGIGTTEMLHIFISHRRDDDVDPSATGYPVPGYECKVVDPDTGEEVDRGEAGLLAVRGPTGVDYWDRPDEQARAVRDGWSVPGDVFVYRDDDRFEYKSRQGDLIIASGYNVPGPEVENVLQERDEVYTAAVVGSPDEERGKIVKAFVITADGYTPDAGLTETLQSHVKERIAPYKYPREIEYVDDLPTTETGKIRRDRLRERERERSSA